LNKKQFKRDLREKFGGKYVVAYWETIPHKESGEDVIHVGLAKAELTLAEAQDLPAEIDGVKVVYEYTGPVELLTTNFYDPLIGGVSIGAEDVTAGTYGGVVWKGDKPYFLTNEHVVSDTMNSNPAHPPLGHNIVQPGVIDGGTKIVGWLEKTGGMKERALKGEPCSIDAALIKPKRDFEPEEYVKLGHIDSVKHCNLQVGDEIVKVGRTTGVTFNEVAAVGVSANIGGIAWASPVQMEGLIMTRSSFVKGGDSGSRVWKTSTLEPGGLVFAGSIFTSMIIPAETICKKFNISFGDKEPGEVKPPEPEGNWLIRFFRAVWEWLKNLLGGEK